MSVIEPLPSRQDAVPETGIVPPHSLEAEISLLAGIMLDAQLWDDVADSVASCHFYRPGHQAIFAAIASLAEESQPIDLVTVSERLECQGQLEQVGGLSALTELVRQSPGTGNVPVYARIVRDRYELRQLIHTCFDLTRQAFGERGKSARELIEDAEHRLFALTEDQGSELSSVKDMLSRAVDAIDTAFNAKGGITGTPSGYVDLDRLTAGWQPGDLIVVAGRPAMGKTTFGLNLVENALMAATTVTATAPAFVFSVEMPEEQLMLRLIASLGRVSLQKLRTGMLDDEDWPKVTAAVSRLTELEGRLYIDDRSGVTASSLKVRARRMVRRYGRPSLILIDYLQLLHEPGAENRTLEVATVSRILKETAKELHAPVIALSQLNRSLENRPNKRPCLADLRDSGAIEQDADVIAFLYRDEVYHPDNPDNHGLAEVLLSKQRNGPIGTVHLAFLDTCSRFEALEWKRSETGNQGGQVA